MVDSAPFERRLRRRNPILGEASEGAVEAPSDGFVLGDAPMPIRLGEIVAGERGVELAG